MTAEVVVQRRLSSRRLLEERCSIRAKFNTIAVRELDDLSIARRARRARDFGCCAQRVFVTTAVAVPAIQKWNARPSQSLSVPTPVCLKSNEPHEPAAPVRGRIDWSGLHHSPHILHFPEVGATSTVPPFLRKALPPSARPRFRFA